MSFKQEVEMKMEMEYDPSPVNRHWVGLALEQK